MKGGYRAILAAKPLDRRQIYSEATEKWPTSAHFIEKDLIVCATLDVLFSDVPGAKDKLVFKGGTSLSKAHNLIQRFSEDIDLVIVREELGFSGENDPLQPKTDISGGKPLSRKARERLIEDLKAASAEYVKNEIRPRLVAAFDGFGFNVEIDPTSNGQTVLISYSSAFDTKDQYIEPIIKVEAGARSATLPANAATIVPYIDAVIDDIDLTVPSVQTIDADRTFLDKLLILHSRHCHYRDRGSVYKNANRESRHYYDLAVMADIVGPRALANADLLKDVITHSSLAFPSGWAKFDEAAKGDLLICPLEGMEADLKRDYNAMSPMIFGENPGYEWVMSKITAISDHYIKNRHHCQKPL